QGHEVDARAKRTGRVEAIFSNGVINDDRDTLTVYQQVLAGAGEHVAAHLVAHGVEGGCFQVADATRGYGLAAVGVVLTRPDFRQLVEQTPTHGQGQLQRVEPGAAGDVLEVANDVGNLA